MNNLYMGKSSKGHSEIIIKTRDDESGLKQMLSQIELNQPQKLENFEQSRKLRHHYEYNSMFINIPSNAS